MTKSYRGLFEILSRLGIVCYLRSVTAVLTCPLRSFTETGDPIVPYFTTLQHTCMNHFACYPKPGLRRLVCGADGSGKMWSANGQREID